VSPSICAGVPGVAARRTKLAAARRIGEVADLASIVARLAGEKVTNRLLSLADPDPRPIRKGKLRQPTEFGYVVQLAEVCETPAAAHAG
jgi:hypothetical protein